MFTQFSTVLHCTRLVLLVVQHTETSPHVCYNSAEVRQHRNGCLDGWPRTCQQQRAA
jgi:hypothetical protein